MSTTTNYRAEAVTTEEAATRETEQCQLCGHVIEYGTQPATDIMQTVDGVEYWETVHTACWDAEAGQA